MHLNTRRVSFAVVAVGLLASVAACDRGGARSDGAAAAPASSTSSRSPSAFEGEVTYVSSKLGRKPTTATLSFKGSSLRFDGIGDDDPGSFIIDGAGKNWFLLPARKEAFSVQISDVATLFVGAGLVDMKQSRLARTGKKDVVAGYPCEEWTVTGASFHANVCAADSIPWLASLQWPPDGNNDPELTRAFMGHFPLRHVHYDAEGVETSRETATKIDAKPIDDARFVVPADYEKTDLGPLVGGLSKLLSASKQ
jgi:hypothetical protein